MQLKFWKACTNKELAFESKIYWDLLRWFTFDTQINQYRKRGLYSFIFAQGATADANSIPNGKFIYDAKAAEQASDRISCSLQLNNAMEGTDITFRTVIPVKWTGINYWIRITMNCQAVSGDADTNYAGVDQPCCSTIEQIFVP